MSSKEIYERICSLIGAARLSVGVERRQSCIAEAIDLIKQARSLGEKEEAASEGPPEAMPFRVWLGRSDGATVSIELPIDNRGDAFWAAEALAAACMDEFEQYGLWQGANCLYSAQTRHSRFSVETASEVNALSQQSVLEAEELLCRSLVAIGHSRRLLDITARMRRWVAFEVHRLPGPANSRG